MIRLFIAVDLPEAVRQRLLALCAGVPGAKWVGSEQMHLTLRFIGEVDGAQFDAIAAALEGIIAPAFAVRVAGVGHFGDRRRAHVLWAGVEASGELMRLQAKIENALIRAGVARDRRKFHPHITLARLNGAPAGRLAEFLAANGALAFAPFAVGAFVLYSSFLSQSGAIHRPEAIYPLDDSAQSLPPREAVGR